MRTYTPVTYPFEMLTFINDDKKMVSEIQEGDCRVWSCIIYLTCKMYPFFFNDTIAILSSSSSILLR